jgi:hypothetical protein
MPQDDKTNAAPSKPHPNPNTRKKGRDMFGTFKSRCECRAISAPRRRRQAGFHARFIHKAALV